MFEIDKSSSVPLHLQIQTLLINSIRSGEYKPGAQVPSELEIAARQQVSRMTARRALDALVTKGILYRSKGKGTYVADNLVSYGLSTLLSFSQTLRAQGYDVTTRVLRQEVVPASPNVLAALQLTPASEVVVIQRLRLIAGKPAAIHTAFLSYHLFAPLLQIDLSRTSLLASIQEIYGIPIAYSQDSVQADTAMPEEAHFLEIDLPTPVLRVEGIAYAENASPIRLTRAVYRSDLFRLVVKTTGDAGTSLKLSETVALSSSLSGDTGT